MSGNELLGRFGQREARVRAPAERRGPLGTEGDELRDRMIATEITERAYWQARSDEIGRDIVRPEAAALIGTAKAAGIRVGALTNDLRAFHSETGVTGHPLLRAARELGL